MKMPQLSHDIVQRCGATLQKFMRSYWPLRRKVRVDNRELFVVLGAIESEIACHSSERTCGGEDFKRVELTTQTPVNDESRFSCPYA